jgi:hypothetical protein
MDSKEVEAFKANVGVKEQPRKYCDGKAQAPEKNF